MDARWFAELALLSEIALLPCLSTFHAAQGVPVPAPSGPGEPRSAKRGKAFGGTYPSLAVSPDGEWLAVVLDRDTRHGGKRTVCLVKLPSGEPHVLTRDGSVGPCGLPCPQLAFSPDSKQFAVAGVAGPAEAAFLHEAVADYAVQLWDVATGREVRGFVPRGLVDDVAFSPDGKYLAAESCCWFPMPINPVFGPHNLLHLWDLSTRNSVKLSTMYHVAEGLAFSPDGTQLAIGAGKRISLLDVREREEIHRFECGARCAQPIYSADGRFLAALTWHGICCNRSFVQVWDVETFKKLATSPPLKASGCSMAFVPGTDTLATTQPDDTITFSDVATGREVRKLAFPQRAPCAFVFTPNGRALIGEGSEANLVVHMWDASTGKELKRWDLTGAWDASPH